MKNTQADADACLSGDSGLDSDGKKFSQWFSSTGSSQWDNGKKGHEQWGAHNANVVSKDTAALTREEKGVVSSVFAKVIEGAEILEGGSRSKVARYIIKLYISIRISMQ